ncbi:MAG: hypothetical protein KC593_21695 [Myxococcales bacterium]|nr:hypothetical protein [Myxococcales bacterium]MCB9629240.1 hypothetical protein [Sandaracinaceae bacterium]
MSRIPSSPPPAPSLPAGEAALPPHVSIPNDCGIEGIVLQLEEQSRRSRELRNDARDARREQQAAGIRQAHKSARLALAGSLVKQVAQTAASLAQSVGGGERASDSNAGSPKVCGAGAETQGSVADLPGGALGTGTPDTTAGASVKPAAGRGNSAPSGPSGTWTQAIAAAGEASGTLLEHFAQRATTRAEVAANAAGAYDDVADDAAQAEQDASRMADRALSHLDAIMSARRDAVAAILRG